MKLFMKEIQSYASAFVELFFPRLCEACGNPLHESEKAICKTCFRKLPRTGFESNPADNLLGQLLWGRVRIETACALFYYRKGETLQQLLHALKYEGYTHIGQELGRKLGSLIKTSTYPQFDVIVPVPLHPRKYKIRGYNQSEVIANGVSERLNIPVDCTNLHRLKHTASQTSKGRFERWENVEGLFGLHDPEKYMGCHLLLIDDVTTTGATLEACIQPLNRVPYAKVSIATVGCTYL